MPDKQPRTREQIRAEIDALRNKTRLSVAEMRTLDELGAELIAAAEREEKEQKARPTYAELLATPERFRAWLKRQPEWRTFKQRKACWCPLAEFVKEETGDLATVSLDVCSGHEGHYTLPPWAQDFIEKVDALAEGTPITAARCLKILDRVETANG